MHRQLRDHLRVAQGDSCRVIVVFLDVRGFTSFAGSKESTETAAFLRAMYSGIIDDYFPDATFFKPTGDGLMVILAHPEEDEDLSTAFRNAVETSIRLVGEFGSIADDDLMVNFDTPQNLGIGIARGSVTRIHTGDITLDYSGRYLNLAARLMDLARPKGVAIQDRFAAQFLEGWPDEVFETADVYLKGIADSEPLSVFYTSAWTNLPPEALRPRSSPKVYFDPDTSIYTLKDLRDGPFNRSVRMSRATCDPDSVEVHYEFTSRTGNKRTIFQDMAAELHPQPEGDFARFQGNRLFQLVDQHRPKHLILATPIRVQAKYLVTD